MAKANKPPTNAYELNLMLMDVVFRLSEGTMHPDYGDAICKAVDRINRNNINQIEYKRLMGHDEPIDYMEEPKSK